VSTALLVAGSILIGLSALFHGYVFYLESIAWTRPATRRVFGVTTAEEADTMRPMAFNQGFYNLFLAIGAAVGVALLWNTFEVGLGLILLAAGSMVLAALVLVASAPRLRRSALLQGAPPLVGIVLILLSLAF
jgi:putative membrane protein